MRKAVARALVGAGLILVVACGKSEFTRLSEEVADEICKCKDILCVNDVQGKYSEKLAKAASQGSADEAVIKANEKQAECIKKLMSK